MNPNISIPPTAADAYRAMLDEQTYASLEEVTVESTLQLNEAAIKAQIIAAGYVYFPDDDQLYKVSPYKLIGNSGKLATLGVQKWYSVNVATGEDLADAGLAEVDVDNKGNYFVVNSNNSKLTAPALISSEPNKIYL
jgi:hypothetical protein